MKRIMKSTMMFLLAAVMMLTATVTAYADYNGYAGLKITNASPPMPLELLMRMLPFPFQI